MNFKGLFFPIVQLQASGGGQGGQETGRKGGGRCTGCRRRGDRNRLPKVAGEKGKNYATLHNILQSKKGKEVGANKYREGTGIRKQEV